MSNSHPALQPVVSASVSSIASAPAAPAVRSSARRNFLRQAGALAAGGSMAWVPTATQAATAPAGFPTDLPLYQQVYENWAKDIRVDAVLTCAPRNAADVLRVCNWAKDNGWRVRPRGHMHNWSPLTLPPGAVAPRVLLLDTTRHLTACRVVPTGSVPSVIAQTGIAMDDLVMAIEAQGFGFTAMPAPGDLTLGGVLAINGHGTGVRAAGESRLAGKSYGSLSNAILSLTAVVYDAATSQYVLRTYARNDPAIGPLLTHVGRAFIVEARLQIGPDQRLRCRSIMDVSATELFAAPGNFWLTRKLSAYVEQAGRVEVILFPFTEFPWLKVWSLAPNRPWTAVDTNSAYNYPFSDTLAPELADGLSNILAGNSAMTPSFGMMAASITMAGLSAHRKWDLWGPSRHTLHYVKPTTLRVTANGYAVLIPRRMLQQALNDFHAYYQQINAAYAWRGEYPMNGPLEIRITGLDQPAEVGVAGAVAPWLSALRPVPGRPDIDTAIWFDVLTFPGTPAAARYYAEMEQWMRTHYSRYGVVRVEWSKGWGYHATGGAWADPTVLGYHVPQSFTAGQPTDSNWAAAKARLHALDPYHLFSSPMLERLFA